MRRAITEWGLVSLFVLSVAVSLMWVDSLFLRHLHEPVLLGSGVYMRVEDGQLVLFNELGDNWKPRFGGVDDSAISWVRSYTIWFFPGIEYHDRLFANGRTIWSLELYLVVPLCVLLTMMAIFWRVRRGSWIGQGRSYRPVGTCDAPN